MLSFNDYLENQYDEPSGYTNNNDHDDDVDDGDPGHGDPGTDLKQWHRGIRQRLGLGVALPKDGELALSLHC